MWVPVGLLAGRRSCLWRGVSRGLLEAAGVCARPCRGSGSLSLLRCAPLASQLASLGVFVASWPAPQRLPGVRPLLCVVLPVTKSAGHLLLSPGIVSPRASPGLPGVASFLPAEQMSSAWTLGFGFLPDLGLEDR